MGESDASLVSRSVAEDPAVFVELLRRHGLAVHAYLARRCGSDDADDLLSEVWLHAFGARATYDRRWPDARPWLYGIARNVLRTHWRRQRRPSPPGERGSSDPWPDVDARLDAVAQAAALRRALAALPDDDRAVLLLVTWEGLAPAEVAIALAIPPGTARSRLHRARTSLRQLLLDDPAFSAEYHFQEA
jgi:RNA polymerase sigma-70 factor (ECF subfamily)